MAYSDGKSFSSMQEEAIRRVREMQKRSRSIVGGEGHSEPAPPYESAEGGRHDNNAQPEKVPDQHGVPLSVPFFGGGKGGGLFDLGGVRIDEEKAMIALLIYILYKQGADVKLLLGLGYLLL